VPYSNDNLQDISTLDRQAEESDSEEDAGLVCMEDGSCEERRFLLDHTDYKKEGANNPVVDPPGHN
jgi:hypothetical protein